ncbi:sensor histidine kinase [Roseateles saccharophilus]|uniref:histidine kinase n=1 Tax=Roseateles saccharophilus TaxID=304 RepID=A0A4R3ULV3_ROSSA|nr:sensor histidine kinase [Roseateles saccharophilus]MDG0833843.1 sensor histidine kinase [Roseateles saccharophilus]TCU91531.1 two-component system sensor histidine kinase TctE [Roseateles saccharophilus]
MFSRPSESLRLQLLRWLLPPLLLLLTLNAWLSNRAAVSTADMAFDRLLTASAEAIAEDVAYKDGELVVDLPYAALELLESNIQERIFYRVVSPAGQTVTGYDDLPLPKVPRAPGAELILYTADYRGERIHLVALAKQFYGTDIAAPALILVAETGEAREALSRQIVVEGLTRQSALIIAAAIFVWLGLVRGLKPLARLRRSVEQRSPSDLSPIDPSTVQAEVRPVIEALNQHTSRLERVLTSRQRLTTDASHQMRTPLAEMRTQIEYCLRQNRPELAQQTLRDVLGDVDRLSRLVSQLLLQARSDPDGLAAWRRELVDVVELARQTALDHVGLARKKSIDLGFEEPPGPALVAGNGLLLRELIANLIDNAILYGREGGRVDVRVALADGVVIEVEDDGPGIAAAEQEQVFERFYRSPAAVAQGKPGSGLGLAIVRDIARAHQGRVELLAPAGGCGLRVRVTLPAAPT